MLNYKDDFAGKIAVVTGAASGIGRETVIRLSQNGAKVVLWDYNEKDIQLVSEKLDNDSIFSKVDVSDENSIKTAAEIARNKIGTPTLLVNCAGVAGDNATVANTSPNEWRRVLSINLTGTFLCCRELVKGMTDNGYGRIVNIASVAGKEGNPNAAHYSASKAGVITFTRSLAKEISNYGVLVNSITPAVIDTEMLAQVSDAHKDYMVSKIPMGRMGKTSEVTSLICWLLSKECSYSTAATFDLSGGRATY